MIDPTQRFSTRVENYVKYRPGYPPEVIDTLREACGLTPAWPVADIGSGTGILTELLLRNGNHVFAVEPNAEMRQASERFLRGYPRFHSVTGRAEATTLADNSVDLIVAGQAFHWFDPGKARAEFVRVLHAIGWIMLVWNDRDSESTPFMQAYEQLLQSYAIDYPKVDHRQVDLRAVSAFYGPEGFQSRTFDYQQEFDFDGLRGRLESSSYAPEADHPDYQPMLATLHKIFQVYQSNNRVAFGYVTRMYYGRLS